MRRYSVRYTRRLRRSGAVVGAESITATVEAESAGDASSQILRQRDVLSVSGVTKLPRTSRHEEETDAESR